jgi:hypothetical protein
MSKFRKSLQENLQKFLNFLCTKVLILISKALKSVAMKIEPKPSETKHVAITKDSMVVKVESKSSETTIVAIDNVCIEMKVELDCNKCKIVTIDKEYKKKF